MVPKHMIQTVAFICPFACFVLVAQGRLDERSLRISDGTRFKFRRELVPALLKGERLGNHRTRGQIFVSSSSEGAISY